MQDLVLKPTHKKVFFGYREPHHEERDEAVAVFKEGIPAIAD